MTSEMTEPPSCIAPRYLAGFRCIASACEEDCCHGWQISIDQHTFKKIKNAMDRTKLDRERFRQFIKRNRSVGKGDITYASIALCPDGSCPFLDEGKLCEIHRRFGPSHLSLVCRSYPRKKSQVGHRTELAAFLSCPEVARRCLLDPEAMELLDMELGRLDSDAICTQVKPTLADDPYMAYLDEVRQVILNLVTIGTFPLATSLFFVACFADSVSPHFSRGSSSFSLDALADEIDLFSDLKELNGLNAQFEQIDSRIDFAMVLVQQILTARLKNIPRDFVALLDQTWSNYNLLADSDFSRQENEHQQSPAALEKIQQVYQQRRTLIQRAFSQRIDQYFGNYSLNYWFAEWYTGSPDLIEHTLKLFIRLAILRFLFFSHPGLNPVVEQLTEGKHHLADCKSTQAVLDNIAVETAYRFSRGVEHDSVYLKEIQQTLADKGMEPLALLTLLLKF